MIIETKKGNFTLLKNVKEAFEKTKFEEKYIEECFDRYDYIVGDISSEILRLKGFDSSNKGNKSYKCIPDYLYESCAFNCAYYILKREKNVQEEKVKEEL